jgi:hypothetical protein
MPLQYAVADQTAALQSGHFAPKSALGAHVTRLLVGNEADPGQKKAPAAFFSCPEQGVLGHLLALFAFEMAFER